MRAGVLEDDGSLRCPLRRLSDKDGPRLRFGLNARGGADEIPGDHSLPLGAQGHRGLTREDSGPGSERRVELRDDGDEVESGPDCALGIVLARDGSAPNRHHCVPDELLDGAAVPLDDRPRGLEVA